MANESASRSTASLHSGSADDLVAANVLPFRPPGPRDPARESRALDALVARINTAPDQALQALVETAASLCASGSAGISVLRDGRFHWPAIAGLLTPYLGHGLPQDASPCGLVIERNQPLLFDRPERLFSNVSAMQPAAREALLVPLLIDGAPRGTLWVVAHDDHRFDSEDVRILERLAMVAIAIQQTEDLRVENRRIADTARHRVTRTLAMLRALLRRAGETDYDETGDALLHLGARVEAFADGAGSVDNGRRADLYHLVAHALARRGERLHECVRLTGPAVDLSPDIAGPLALAFHELLENAWDHGALGRSGGRVTVDWTVEGEGAARILVLDWRESGGLALARNAHHRGFGLELLEDGLPGLIGATTAVTIAGADFHFSLRLPLDADPA